MVNKKPKKPWYSENCNLLRKHFTRIAKLLQKDSKTTPLNNGTTSENQEEL